MMNNIFIGPLGLRAGWRLLLFVVVLAALIFGMQWMSVRLHLPSMVEHGAIRPGPALLSELEQFLEALFATLFMVKLVDRRMWCEYGLPLPQALRRLFWTGAMAGLAALSAQLVVMRLLRVFYFGHMGLPLFVALHYGAVWLLVFLLVGLAEEFLLRGYLLRTLTDGIGFWPAAALTSLLFALAHTGNSGESKIGILAVFVVGLFLCLTVRRTGHLWWAVGFHTGWDWAQSFLFGVADSGMVAQGHLLSPTITGNPVLSGGSVGPEGSALIYLTIGVMALLFHRAYPAVKYDRRKAAGAVALGPETQAHPL